MRLVVVGRADELTGFALAGVETAACASPEDANGRVAILGGAGSDAGLVIVSPWAGRHAAHAIAGVRRRKGPPVIVVIPDLPASGD